MPRLLPPMIGLLVAMASFLVQARGATGNGPDRPGGLSRGGEPLPARLLAYQQHALTHDGDPDRGKALFFDESRVRCVGCHRVAGRGGGVGPDLSAIGGKFARPHLIESLLEPSRQILEGFRTSLIVTRDGRVEQGIVKQVSDAQVTIVDAAGKTRAIPRGEIETLKESVLSLMPEGLADTLTAPQFTDLIAFLESLRPSGGGSPGSQVFGGLHLPDGFTVSTVASGLTGCTALEVMPDGRVLVCEQTGALRVVKGGRLLPAPALTVAVDSSWERGLIGVTVGPDYPASPYVYVCYVAREPYPHHRVSRFTMRGDAAEPGSEVILIRGDDQTKLGGHVPAGHQGGAIHFGADGALYVAIGDQTAGAPSQDLNTFQGKILRINADGGIPADNPFEGRAAGKYRAIWALGLRNPYTFAIHRSTGVMCINDVGENFEEINRGVAGGNYGWPAVDGPGKDPRFLNPIHAYPHASVCGGDFAPDDPRWPARLRGKYVFGEFIHGWVKALDPDNPARVETLAVGLRNPVDLRFAPDGGLYVLLRNAWVIDGKFQPGTGALIRIQPPGTGPAK